jgi:hypothetical protein
MTAVALAGAASWIFLIGRIVPINWHELRVGTNVAQHVAAEM